MNKIHTITCSVVAALSFTQMEANAQALDFTAGTSTAIVQGGQTVGFRYNDVLGAGSGAYAEVIVTSSPASLGGFANITDESLNTGTTGAVSLGLGTDGTIQQRLAGTGVQVGTSTFVEVANSFSFSFFESDGSALDISNHTFSVQLFETFALEVPFGPELREFLTLGAGAQNITLESSTLFDQDGLTYVTNELAGGGGSFGAINFEYAAGTSQFDFTLGQRLFNRGAPGSTISSTLSGEHFPDTHDFRATLTPVPEPTSAILCLIAAGLGMIRRHR